MSKNPINKKLIAKTIKTTQLIEGYSQADSKTIERAKSLREKYGIKVSVQK